MLNSKRKRSPERSAAGVETKQQKQDHATRNSEKHKWWASYRLQLLSGAICPDIDQILEDELKQCEQYFTLTDSGVNDDAQGM